MTRHKSNNSRRLAFQQLEDRSLMTGNVTVAVQNHTLIVTGDNHANDIQIEQSASGQFTITGLNGTTINGHTTPMSFTGVTKDVKIDLKDGSDKVRMGGVDGLNFPAVNIQGNLSIKTGNGNDHVAINANIKGNLDIDAGSGNDTVELLGVKVGSAGGNQNATVQMGSSAGNGFDTLDGIDFNIAHDFSIKTANSTTGLSLYMDANAANSVGHDLNLQTGNGADNMAIYNTKIGHKLNVKTNSGADFLGLSADTVDQVFVDMGSGDDYLVVIDTTARVANFNGNSGTDKVEFNEADQPNHFQSVNFNSFETKLGLLRPIRTVVSKQDRHF
jgi:hypothetical protein